MKKFPIALRISIPVILLVFGSVLGGFSFYRDISLSFARTEKNATTQARFSGDQVSGMLEYLFRKNDVEGAELVISKLGGDPALKLAILSDENNNIILSTRYEMRKQKISDTEVNTYLLEIESVKLNMSGTVKMTENRDMVHAIYPVVLGSVPGEVRPSKLGVLLLKYDVSKLKNITNNDALQRSLEATVVLAISSFLVWIFFEKTLTNRAILLVKATNNLAKGNLDERSGLQGSDELSQISVAFDRMADKIQLNQSRIKKVAERSELLNYLASQIRNSLELEKVLGTAVEEIRNLFQIERCKFLWCSMSGDKPPKFVLSHEASVSEDSNSISHDDTIWQMQTLGKHLQNLELLRIDDVSTDSKLDHKSQGLLTYLGISSLLIAFLRTHSGQIGVIVCENCQEARPWDDDEVELLQSVANQLAIAIDQAELYSESQNAAVIAEAQANKLSTTLTELQQTQAQLIQTEKMSSLGQMVAGVAHEINNPVNFIYANLGHANQYFEDLVGLILLYQKNYPHPKPEITQMVEDVDLNYLLKDLPGLLCSMEMGADRIRQIVLTLRNFSRLDEAEMKPVDIHEGIDSTLVILRSRIKANRKNPAIEIVQNHGELPKVECYAGQLNQVFMNIISNAIDALREHNKTRLLDQVTGDPMKITISTQLIDSNWVSICIKDNGSGIPEAVREKIFDPFFTTKPVGEGTGLGLSISYQIIVEKHRGQLKCISEPGKGTEFWIQIPLQHHNSNKGASIKVSSIS